MKFDKFDRAILAELQKDGRISNQDLAEKVGLSPSPCLRRLRDLEKSGVVKGYGAFLDESRLGLSLTALLLVSMDKHTPERFSEFEARVDVLPNVLECLMVTGQEADYQLRIVVADMEEYRKLLLDRLATIPGVVGMKSSFVLRRPKAKGLLPV